MHNATGRRNNARATRPGAPAQLPGAGFPGGTGMN